MNTERLFFDNYAHYLGLGFKRVTLAIVIAMAGSITGQAIADNVVIFKEAPTAEEMGNLLFPETGKPKTRSISASQPKTRSISFSNPYKEEKSSEPESFGLLIKFARNSSDILSDSLPYLDEVGKMLNMERVAQEKILIEGHADASGNDYHNLILSKRRAQAVKEYLVQQHNVAGSRMLVSGKGETRLLTDRDPYDPLNRRVQFYKAP